MSSRTVPIIGVFGSDLDYTIDPARAVGAEVVRRGCILLTGAELPLPDAEPETVKDAAQVGASQVAARVAYRIGVASTPVILAAKPDPAGRWIALYPGYTHKRNYVEAQICDGAIALPGGDGTASEILFCLAVGRPVVWLGNWADHDHENVARAKALNELLKRAKKRMRKAPVSPLDSEIDDAYARIEAEIARLNAAPPVSTPKPRRALSNETLGECDYAPVPTDPEAVQTVVTLARDLISARQRSAADAVTRPAGLPGLIPGLAEYGEMRTAYTSWLEQVGQS